MMKKFLILFLLILLIMPSWVVNSQPATADTLEGFVDYPTRLHAQIPPPSITSVSPASAYQGQELTLTILGSGFVQQPSLVFVPTTGISIASTTFISSGEIRANIKISSNAPVGSRDVVVFNPDQQSGTLKIGFTVGSIPQVIPGSIVLTPVKAENPVSTAHTLVATVLDTDKEPMPGVKVVFTVSGANPTTGTGITDDDGEAVFSYQGVQAGDDTITAAVDNLKAIAYKHWYVPQAVPGSIKLTPEKAENPVSTTHTLVATVLDTDKEPLPGVKVVFTVSGTNPNMGTGITDDDGEAVFSYQGVQAGDDTITAAVDNLKATAYKHWQAKTADTTPPRITSGPGASQITRDSAIISWTTDEESDSKVSYDTRADSFRFTREDTPMVKEHYLTLTKLEPGKVYLLVVESGDKDGNLARSRPFTFETASPADKEKPSVSLVLPERLSGKKVIIRADAHDDTNVDKVVFYLDDKPVFTDFTAPFEWEFDASAHKEGIFHFGAEAFDAANNAAEAARDGEISRHFPGELSPVKVRIITPDSGDEVYGDVGISAEIDDEDDLGFSYIEFKIDDTILSETTFDPPYYFTPILSPMFIVSQHWDSTTASRGEHVISVRVRDEADNWGDAGIRVRVVEPPTPTIDVTRDVQRIDNCFEVTLTVRNSGSVDVNNLKVADSSHNFQPAEDVLWRRGESGSFSPLYSASTVTCARDRYGESTIEISLGVLRAGETKALRYYAVPIMTDPGEGAFTSAIGYALRLSFDAEGSEYSRSYASSWSSSSLRQRAFQASDYLIVTCPANLFDHDTEANVSELLSVMAQLAREKNGVLGYISSRRAAEGAQSLKNLIQSGGRWSQSMATGWEDSGYLLLVGETEIVPAWDYRGVPLSDFPYGNTKGDERLELRVGRIIGNSAADLAIPIRSSLQGVYDGSHALLVGGPEDTWEPNVLDITTAQAALSARGISVRLLPTEYWTTDYIMLAEAVRIRKAPQPPLNTAEINELRELTEFLLKYLGTPRGAGAGEDLSGYTAQQLAAWLMWARNMLAPSVTKDNAIDDAVVIVSNNGGLGGAMWGVMKNMLMGSTVRLFTTNQLAAWLLWEETSPRGPLTSDTLGTVSIGGVSRRLVDMTRMEMVDNADAVIAGGRLDLAKTTAEAIQVSNPTRGGISDPWYYTYVADTHAMEAARSAAIKAEAAGKDIVLFCGHGDPGGWCGALTDWIGTGSEIEPIDLGGTNPIVIGFACDTGNYQQSPQRDSRGTVLNPNPSISEKFLKNGAAVYTGATVPMLYDIMNQLVREKFWNHWSGRTSIGDIMVSVKTEVFGLGERWQPFNYYYNIYGDPKYGQR